MATQRDILRLNIEVDAAKGTAQVVRFGNEVKRTGKKTTDATKLMKQGFAALGLTLSVGAFRQGIRALDEMISRADKIQSLSRAFKTLTGRVGETSSTMISALRPATQGLVSDMQLMQSVNQAVILGLPVTADRMAKMSEQAILLGRAMGQDAKTSIDSMIIGIGRQSRMMLDNIGIIVDTEQAYKDFAESIGVNVDELTVLQQKVAFTEATLRQMDDAVVGLDKNIDSNAATWVKLKVAIENTKNQLSSIATESTLAGVAMGLLAFELAKAKALLDLISPSGKPEGAEVLGGVASQDAVDRARNAVMERQAIIDMLQSQVDQEEAIQLQRLSTGALAAGGPEGLEDFPVGDASVDLLPVVEPDLGSAAAALGLGNEQEAIADQFANLTAMFEMGVASQEEYRIGITMLSEDLASLREQGLTGYIEGLEQVTVAEGVAGESAEQLARKQQQAMRQRVQMMRSMASQVSSLLGAIFGRSKEVQIAQAVINTAAAVMQALASGPPPASYATAAVAAAMGAAQIARIQSTSIGGGGGGVTAPIAPAAAGVQDSGGGGGGRTQVFVNGQQFITDPESFARDISQLIDDQNRRAGG